MGVAGMAVLCGITVKNFYFNRNFFFSEQEMHVEMAPVLQRSDQP